MKMPPFGIKCNTCKTGTIWHEPADDAVAENGLAGHRRSSTCKCHGLPPLRLDAKLATSTFTDTLGART